jgi:ABC-type dipeptide/oligopeptide/nickel transport system permease component
MGVGLGVVSALHRNSLADYASVLGSSFAASVPAFVFAVFLIYVFGVQLHWLPTFGWDTRDGLVPGLLPRPRQMVLPVIALAALPAATLARVTRASLLEVLEQDYMRTARAKGLGRAAQVYRHALRNAAIPVLSLIGPIAAALLMGSLIIEQMFSIPGSGRLLVQSINARDYGMIMGATLFYAVLIVIANLAVDIAYAWSDPRLRPR